MCLYQYTAWYSCVLLECPNTRISSKRLCGDRNRKARISNLSGVWNRQCPGTFSGYVIVHVCPNLARPSHEKFLGEQIMSLYKVGSRRPFGEQNIFAQVPVEFTRVCMCVCVWALMCACGHVRAFGRRVKMYGLCVCLWNLLEAGGRDA